MSWLGGSISSLTGQISNLTKDILTEGTEEVSDHATELRLAQEKIAEFQTLCGALKTENDRLKIVNRELEEKAESSELQINSISSQYRDVLQEKENDLKELKKKHNEILEHQARSALSPLTVPSTAHVPAPSQPGSLSTQTGLGFSEGVSGSEWDLGDNISLQHEINRLRQEATRLQTEAQHWKSVAGQLSQTGTSNEQFEASNAEIIQLRDRAKELEHQLVQARDHQQHEVVSLQDVHTDKMAAIKKKHKQEVADFKRQIAALEQQLSESRDNDSMRHGSSNLPEADRAGLSSESDVSELRRELQDLHTQLSKVNTEKNKIETAKRHLEGVLEELQTEVGKLQDERDGYVEKITLLDSTVADQRAELETLKQAAGDDVVQLKQALEQALSEKSCLEKEVGQQGQVKSNLMEVKSLSTHLTTEAAAIVESLGSPGHQQVTAELVASLEKENLYLKEQNLKCQEQITLLERAASTQAQERSRCEDTISRLKGQLQHDVDESSSVSTLNDSLSTGSVRTVDGSDISELSRRNRELDLKVEQLQTEVDKYKTDIDQFEFVKSDWQLEKESLEEVLLQLRKQLQEKEMELNIALAQKGLAEVKRQEKKSQAVERTQTGEVVEETIVAEHQDLLQTGETTLEADIETFAAQAQKLSDANLQLEEERDQLEADKVALEEKIKRLENNVSTLEKSLQSEKQASPQQQQQLEQKVLQHEVEMKAMEQEKLDLESSLEELDQQHQQAMDKLISIRDDLSQQVDTLNTSLSQKDTEIINLTEELDKSRAQIEEAASSSKDLTDATGGPDEALVEELQAKLEKMESDKAKEIQDLKEKCQNAAVAVNDLHMDKRELQEELGRVKQEITGKVAKLKEMREDHTRLVEENKDLRERLQEAEDEIEDWQERNEQTQVHNSQKEVVSKEMEELQNEISELRSKLDEYYTACEHEKTRCSQLLAENQRLSVQSEQFEVQKQESTRQASQSLHDRISVLETQFDAVNLDKVNLEKEISQLEDKLHAQTKHYESYIQELQSSQDKDATALQQDHQAMMQTCHEKELAISDLQSQVNSLKSELDMTKETMQTSVDSQLQLTSILKEKDDEISSLKSANIELNSEYEELCAHLKEQEVLMESMKGMEKLLADSKEEIQRLRTEIEVNKMNMEQQKPDDMDQQQTLEIITELEKELTTCKDKIFRLEETVHSQESLINDHKAGITQLNEKHEGYIREIEEERIKLARQDDLILILQEKSADKDEEIADLKNKLTRASSLVDAKKLQLLNEEDSQPGLPALEYPEKAAIEYTSPSRKWDEEEFVDKDDFDGDTSNKIEMISKEIGELQLRLQEKDLVIQELQSNNASLLTMLEAKSLTSHGDKSLVSVHKLENEVKALKMEREQIMAVMTEKSRESSSLKAEVHRLMSVVTAEKSALNKLQEDNHQLQNRENPVDDMQREALQNLSRLVRDRELEIEALKQKNDTLLAVLQDSSQETQGTQINSLLQDKDNLSKQMMTFQAEREQMITYLNQKHQESVTYHNEIQRLTALVSTQTEQFEALNRNYTNLVPQFEDKTQTLLKTQNELLNYKQKYNELEVKYGELLGRSNMSETVDVATYNSKMVELQKCQDRLSELQQEINDRDLKIQGLSSKIHELESVVSSKEAERTSFKKQADNLTFQLQGLQTELQDFRTESVSTKQKSSEIDSELQVLKDSNNQLTLSLREKEFELTSLREKTGTLTTLLQQQQGEQGQVDHLVQENASLHQQTVQYQQERDQAVMALRQKQTDVEELNKEIARLKEKEMKLSRELERLRQHLLQIEEGYTGEALEAEEREKELRNRLAVAEEKILSSSSAVQNASQAASEQVETLQHQLHGVTSQRDAAYMQMTAMQDQCQQYAASLANLQMVLEQFQQDKDAQIAADTERYQDEIKLLKDKVNTLQRALDSTKTELEEASDGLEAASRLSEQLDKKEEAVAALKEEVLLREKTLKAAEEEIRKLTTSTEAKVDKLLMKNMLIGYFQTPTGRRNEVIHMMGGVLNFQVDDYAKINQTQTSWVAGFLRFGSPRAGPTPPTTPVHAGRKAPSLDQSFSQLFVKFLEKESSPPPPPVRMPAEKMAQEVKDKHKESQKPVFNPFTAPRHVSMPLQLGEQTATTKPHILMAPMSPVTQTNPLMAPVSGESLSQPGSGRSTPQNSSAILKDVLGTR